MKKLLVAILLLTLAPYPVSAANAPGSIEVFFSPNGGATQAITREIDRAKKTILVQAYSFTSTPIAKALVAAKKRGVSIEAVLDKSNRSAKYSAADFLAHAGAPVYIDDQHQIAHNKIILIDGQTIITGSFNFSKAAESNNAENLLVIKDGGDLYRKYLDNYQLHKNHSQAYQAR